jgi:hypothetical protein
MKKQYTLLLVFIVLAVMVSGCFPGPNAMVDVPGLDSAPAGFLKGLWHGIIAPFTFFISLFTENVSLYEVHNTGGWYDFGFVLGAGILFGGSGRAAKGKCK